MSIVTTHFLQRLKKRLSDNGLDFDLVKLEIAKIVKTEFNAGVSYAVLVKDLGEHYGDDCFDYYNRYESNGSCLWIIVRGNKAITFFFRRTNQPSTTEALRVDKIVRIQKR